MTTGQATVEELITVLVGETNEAEDDEYKTPEQLRSLMRKHYTVGGLTDVLSVFGPVKDDVKINEKKSNI
jgi:Mg2+/Co2+ transporter CorC